MRKFGRIALVAVGVATTVAALRVLSVGALFPFIYIDMSLAELELALFLQKRVLVMLAGTLLIAFARPLSRKLFSDTEMYVGISPEDALHALLIALGVYIGLNRTLAFFAAVQSPFGSTTTTETSPPRLLFSLLFALVFATILIRSSRGIVSWVFPVREDSGIDTTKKADATPQKGAM